MRRGLGVMAARVLAYHAAPAPCLARAGARARHGHAPRPADLAAWVPRHAGISRRRNSMLALCPEALKEEEASASYTAPTPTPTPYVPQSEDYAGAGAVVPQNDDALPGGHVVLMDGMSMIFRSFYGWRNRDTPLLNSKGEDVSVQYSVAHAILGVLELEPTHLAVCFDAKGKTFRHEMFTGEFILILVWAICMTSCFVHRLQSQPTADAPRAQTTHPARHRDGPQHGRAFVDDRGVEADDIIGTVARRGIESGLHVSVVSPDKDFFQLLGPRVRQLRPNGRNGDASNGGDYDTQKAGDGGGAAGTNGFGPHGFKELSARGLVSFF